MKGNRIMYFSNSNNLKSILTTFVNNFDVDFIETGLFDTKDFSRKKIEEIVAPNVPFGDWVHNDRYLIIEKDNPVFIREVPQRRGGMKYAIDGNKNPDSLLIVIGGAFDENTIIAGEIFMSSKTDFTTKSFGFFNGVFKKNFLFKKGWFISNEISNDVRLTTCISSPSSSDMKL